MATVARKHQKKEKTANITAETTERIVAAALSNPTLGADRLAQLLGDEGVDVSRGLVYRTLRGRSLQNRELRVRFLEKQSRLGQRANSREPKDAPLAPDEPFREQLQEPLGPLVTEPAFEYPAPLAPEILPTPAEEKREAPVVVVPAFIAKPAARPRVDQLEKSPPGKEKWLFHGINLLLVAFLVFLGIRIGGRLYDERQEPSVAATPLSALDPNTEAAATAEPNRPLSDYRVILDRNLFGSANTPASNSAREAAEIEAIGLAGNEVGLKLIGTAVGKDRRMNYAVLEVTKTRSQEILREKDMVGNVLIKRIFRNNVIILTASGEKRLSVDEKLAAGTAASPVQPSAVAMSFSGVPQVNPETKEMTHEISRSEITQSLPSLRQMLEESNSSANIREGKNDGFTIGRLRSRDAFFRIGLRTGDVIKSVDGEAVDNMDDAELLIDKLAEGGDFSILVERRGQLESLNLSIK